MVLQPLFIRGWKQLSAYLSYVVETVIQTVSIFDKLDSL